MLEVNDQKAERAEKARKTKLTCLGKGDGKGTSFTGDACRFDVATMGTGYGPG
jgi:hypothetical protein